MLESLALFGLKAAILGVISDYFHTGQENLPGDEIGKFLEGRLAKLKEAAHLGTPGTNHDIQQTIAETFWLSLLFIVAKHGQRAGVELRLPHHLNESPRLQAACRWLWDRWPANQPAAVSANGEFARKLYAVLVEKAGKAEFQELTSVEGVYAQMEALLPRDEASAKSVLADLNQEALLRLTDLANAHQVTVTEDLERSVREEFCTLFRGAFSEAVKSNERLRGIFQAILTSEIHAGITEIKMEQKLQREYSEKIIALLEGRPQIPPFLPPPPKGKCFGRDAEIQTLAKRLASADGKPLAVCSLHGYPGVGKSFLVESYISEHWKNDFPGGYVSLKLQDGIVRTGSELLSDLRIRFGIPDTPEASAVVHARLLHPRTLLHIENLDAEDQVPPCLQLLSGLGGVAVVVSTRLSKVWGRAGWDNLPVDVLTDAAAFDLLCSLRKPQPGKEETKYRSLLQRLGNLPLAIRLIGVILQEGESSLDDLLTHPGLLEMDPGPGGEDRHRTLRVCFQLAWESLLSRAADRVRSQAVLRNFGHAPLAGIGLSVGTALCGCAPMPPSSARS